MNIARIAAESPIRNSSAEMIEEVIIYISISDMRGVRNDIKAFSLNCKFLY